MLTDKLLSFRRKLKSRIQVRGYREGKIFKDRARCVQCFHGKALETKQNRFKSSSLRCSKAFERDWLRNVTV